MDELRKPVSAKSGCIFSDKKIRARLHIWIFFCNFAVAFVLKQKCEPHRNKLKQHKYGTFFFYTRDCH